MNVLDLAECQAELRKKHYYDWRVTLHPTSLGPRFMLWNPNGKAIAAFGRYNIQGWETRNMRMWWSHVYELGADYDRHYCRDAVDAMNQAIKIWQYGKDP